MLSVGSLPLYTFSVIINARQKHLCLNVRNADAGVHGAVRLEDESPGAFQKFIPDRVKEPVNLGELWRLGKYGI